MDNAFLFDENSTGICSEEDYPYAMHKRWLRGCASEKGECEPVEHTRVKSFIDVENTVDALVEALVKQPVSVAMYVFYPKIQLHYFFCPVPSARLTLVLLYSEADKQSFQFYRSGVYDDPECGEALDHGVAAVGYGTTEDGIDYFKVRNSWVSFTLVHLNTHCDTASHSKDSSST